MFAETLPIGDFRGTERYAVECVLGAGAFGDVYQVFDRVRGERVALKTLRNLAPSALGLFKNEFRTPVRVVHPNLVLLHDLESDNGRWFFTMELVEGTDLLRHLESTPPGTPARVAALRPLASQLAGGLAALHRAGRLHRDIKPSNVLVTPGGRVVVVDFGLAVEITAGAPEALVGSAAYMAPEVAGRASLGPAADWYSYGVVLYHAATGRLPFEGTGVEVLLARMQHDAPPPRRCAPALPAGFDALCVRLLARDPAARPDADEILAATASEGWAGRARERTLVPAPPMEGGFVGRDGELVTLRRAFDETRAGRPVVARLHGASGIGKSSLAQAFVDGLRRDGAALALQGRCYERESVPFKALDGLIDAVARDLAARSPVERAALVPPSLGALAEVFPALCAVSPEALAPVDPAERRRGVSQALDALLARLAAAQPLVLVLDDAQWGDADSAVLLAESLRRQRSVLLVVCDRGDSAAPGAFLPALAGALRGVAWREALVGPLEPAAAEGLARDLLPGAAGRHAARVAHESGGNPFFVHELARMARTGAPGTESALTLDGVWHARLEELPPDARRLLSAVAVAGCPLPEAAALRAAHAGVGARAALRLLGAVNLVRTVGPRGDEVVAFHDRVRDAVVAALDPGALAGWHRDVAEALEVHGGAEPETLATHLRAAGDAAAAGRYFALAAARAMRSLAFDRAAELYRAAMASGGASTDTNADGVRALRAGLAEALAALGRGPEAAREFLAACAGAEGSTALGWRLRAADALLRSGHLDEGLPLIREVMAAVGLAMPATPAQALAGLAVRRAALALRGMDHTERPASEVPPEVLLRIDACWTVATALGVVDVVRSADVQTRHLLLALQAGEPFRVARGLAVEAAAGAVAGEAAGARARALLARAYAIGERLTDPTATGIAQAMDALAQWSAGRWRTGLGLAERALRVLRERCTSVSWELAQTWIVAFDTLAYLGRLSDLRARLPGVLADARDRNDLYLATLLEVRFAGLTALADNDAAASASALGAVDRWTHPAFDSVRLVHLHERAAAMVYRGDPAGALACWAAHAGAVRRSLLTRVQIFRGVGACSRAGAHLAVAAQLPATRRAPHLAAAAREAWRLEREGAGWTSACARLLRAGGAAAGGRVVEAVATLERAEAALEAQDMALYAAAAQMHRGRIVGGDAGRALVQSARRRFEAEGVRDTERMAALLAPGFTD